MMRMTIRFIEEWSQWFTPCNWYDFHVIHCHFENDWKFGQFEFRFIILGLGFLLTWVYDGDTEYRREIMKQTRNFIDD